MDGEQPSIGAARTLGVEELFAGALARKGEERERFLDTGCGGDASLREEVVSLLSAHDVDPAFLLVPARRPALGASAGLHLGPWELVAPLGEGGMGVVWRARRADGAYEQDVAVKLLRRGLAERDDALVRRFLAERRTLAALEHPAIARLLDAGTAEDETPWFAMEFVDGEPIDRWCEIHALPRRDRLALFVRVCAAVQFAHGRLIAHRDLKPGNVLVQADPAGGAGVPKLLDFGIAKLLDASLEATTGPQHLTPAYASPEQFRGEPATTACDIHALGVLLFRILTGALPYELEGLSPHALARVVCEHPPRRPSQVDPRIDRDLDTIVLKALEKDPALRYASAGALSEDVERYLTGHPVRAQPAGRATRFWKLVRRNALASAAFAGVFLAVSGLSAWLFVLWIRALDAEELAETRRGHAEAASREAGEQRDDAIAARAGEAARRGGAEKALDLVRKLYGAADPFRGDGRDVRVVDVLDRGVRSLADDPDVEPRVEQNLLRIAGQTYLNLGRLDDAERCFRRVLEIQERSGLGDDRNALRARIDLATLMAHQFRHREIVALLDPVLAMQRERYGSDDPDTVKTMTDLARAHAELGATHSAAALFGELLEGFARRGQEESGPALELMVLRAEILAEDGDLATAEELYLRALAIRTRQDGDSGVAVAHIRAMLARTLWLADRSEESVALYREAEGEFLRLAGPDHDYLLGLHQNLARVLTELGRYEEAEALLVDVVERDARVLGPEHEVTLTAREGLADLVRAAGRDGEAAVMYAEIAETSARSVGPLHPLPLNCRATRLNCLSDLGWHAEAELPLRDLLADVERAPNASADLRCSVAYALATNLARQRCWAEAEERLLRVVECSSRELHEGHRVRRRAPLALLRLYQETGQTERAAELVARLRANTNAAGAR